MFMTVRGERRSGLNHLSAELCVFRIPEFGCVYFISVTNPSKAVQLLNDNNDHKAHTSTGLARCRSVRHPSHVIFQNSATSCLAWASWSLHGSQLGFLVPEHSEPHRHSRRSNMRVLKLRSGALADQHE